jgi:hypothetical protein
VESLSEPKAQGVDRLKVGPVVERVDCANELPYLVARKDVGELLLPADAKPLKRQPIAWHGLAVEELEATVGDAEGGGSEFTVVLKVEEVVTDLLLTEPGGPTVEVVGELPDGVEIRFLGALAEAGQLKILEHPLMESHGLAKSRSYLEVLSQRGKEIPLRRSLYQARRLISD